MTAPSIGRSFSLPGLWLRRGLITESWFAGGPLKPLVRYLFIGAVLFAFAVLGVMVRVESQEIRKDIDRNRRMQDSAQLLNQRLRLELDARRRVMAVESAARSLGIDAPAEVTRVAEPPVSVVQP